MPKNLKQYDTSNYEQYSHSLMEEKEGQAENYILPTLNAKILETIWYFKLWIIQS